MKKDDIAKKITKKEVGKYSIDIDGVIVSYMRSCLGNSATHVKVRNTSFIARTKQQIVDGLYFHLNR